MSIDSLTINPWDAAEFILGFQKYYRYVTLFSLLRLNRLK